MSTNTSNCQDSHELESLKSENPSWWNRRTKLERTLCFTTVLFLVLFVVSILVFIIFGSFSGKHTAGNLCLTPGCVKAAAEILLNIDESVEPCTDFYQFACGKWLDRHIIKKDESSVSSMTKLNDDFLVNLKDLLEKPVNASEPPYVKKIKDLYSSCMNINAIEEEGTEPLKKVLSAFGGWPVVEGKKWNQNKFDWLETLVSFRKLGYSYNMFFTMSVEADFRNNTNYILKLFEPVLSLPDRDYWIELGLNDTTTAEYYKKMVEAAKHLGAQKSVAENELLDVLHFEMALANYSALSDEEKENATGGDDKYTIKELQTIAPQIPWLKCIKNLLGSEIYENETLDTDTLGLLKKIAVLVTTTEKRVIANYMLWRVIEESLPFLSNKWRDNESQCNKTAKDENQDETRYVQCVQFARVAPRTIEPALSAYYFRHNFDEKSNDLVSEIAEFIRKVFLNILDEVEWMDKTTKYHAKSKADKMKFIAGYPKELLNDTLLTDYFKTLTITNESFYENVFQIKKWAVDKEFSYLRKRHTRGQWFDFSETALNGLFGNHDILTQITTPMLRYPFFNKDRPHYMNYAGIGTVIGHEVTHGFDDKGRKYDKDGTMRNWWEADSNEQFKQRAECMVKQYSNYTTEIGINVDGKSTKNENIADNGGLKAAYMAYLSWVEENSPEQLLPGVNYDQKQLFWISHAHVFCNKQQPEALKFQLIHDEHSPGKFRIIGTMSNLEEFSKDFNCPPNSPMNKQPKCQVW